MVPGPIVLQQLKAAVLETGHFQKVMPFPAADLPEAMEAIRYSAETVCFVVPGPSTWEHNLLEGDNQPIRADLDMAFDLLCAAREVSAASLGDAALMLPVEDALMAGLCWESLGLEGLICLPERAEPLRVEFRDGAPMEARRIALRVRQTISNQ